MIVLTTIYYMTGWNSRPPFDKGSVEVSLAHSDAYGVWQTSSIASWPMSGRRQEEPIGSSITTALIRIASDSW